MPDKLWWLVARKSDTGMAKGENDADDPVVFNWLNVDGDVAYPIFTDDFKARRGRLLSNPHTRSHDVSCEAVPVDLVVYFIANRPTERFAIDPRRFNIFASLSSEETLAAMSAAGYLWGILG